MLADSLKSKYTKRILWILSPADLHSAVLCCQEHRKKATLLAANVSDIQLETMALLQQRNPPPKYSFLIHLEEGTQELS